MQMGRSGYSVREMREETWNWIVLDLDDLTGSWWVRVSEEALSSNVKV